MSFLRDAVYGLYGAGRLLRFDAAGASVFENSGEAATRSLRAFYLIIPLYAGFLILLNAGGAPDLGALLHVVTVKVTAQVVIILAYLLIVHQVLALMRLGDRFQAYVGAYNWATVVQIVIAAIGTGLALTPLLGDGGATVVQTVLALLLLAYSGYIARTVLGLDWIFAVGLVVLDMFVTGMVGVISDMMLRSVGVPG
ncbi:MAG: hypothetical protein RLY86_443 [Pseudomonadota bacterium]|jgi:hypothetical protein